MKVTSFLDFYKKFFSLHEWENNKKIYLILWVYVATTFVTFFGWNGAGITSPLFNDCWPHFQSCKNLISFIPQPFGYSEAIWYVGLFVLLGFYVYFLVKKDMIKAHFSLLLLWGWKFFVVFFMYYNAGNFEYYDLILGIVLLFLPRKEFFLGLTFILFYFLASTIKIHDSWILGTYFSSLKSGAPLFSDNMLPLFTNVVIFMQIVGAWFLFSKNKTLQRVAFVYFLAFHIYSGILVGYRYITTTIPLVLILFSAPYDWRRELSLGRLRSFIPGFILILGLFAFQFVGILIKGDQKLTLEGNNYGLYMFESNHQCVSHFIFEKEGEEVSAQKQSVNARYRCDPYGTLKRAQDTFCKQAAIPQRWTFDHSINGGPFYRIVDEENPCNLSYKPFAHNLWIKTEEDSPLIVGYPKKNYYYYSSVRPAVPKNIIFEKPSIELTPSQKFLSQHTETYKKIYWTLWFGTLGSVILMGLLHIYERRYKK